MMYHNKLVASVKCRGKVCKEIGSSVYLPFNEDFTIFLKNLDPIRRAVVNIEIDGKDVLDGHQLIINANDTLELKRHLLNGDMNTGPKFRFVERTSEIEQTRGIDAEDGLLNISFGFEDNILNKLMYPSQTTWIRTDTTYYGDPICKKSPSIGPGGNQVYGGYVNTNFCSTGVDGARNISVGSSVGVVGSQGPSGDAGVAKFDTFQDAVTAANAESENGITVKGEEVNQGFSNTILWGDVVDRGNIVLHLKGQTVENQRVKKPITRKSKKHCSECGKSHSMSAKFCQRCGNNLKY